MRRTILVFGLLSGAFTMAMMLLTLPLHERIGFGTGAEILGYTSIVLSSLFVFFGVRSYREQQADSALTFSRALTVGLAIALISSACYVATWEFIYFRLTPHFMDDYTAHMLDKAKASGASPSQIEETARQMAEFKVMYDKPLMNAAITFLEPFPIGLLVALISAAVLRRPAGSPVAGGSRAAPAGPAGAR
jgi:hypothetical protein